MALSIFVANSLTHKRVGTLPITDFGFNDPVKSPGSFTAKIPIGKNSNIAQIKRLTERDINSLYIQDDTTYVWGGPIVGVPQWDPRDSSISITAVKWKAWLASQFYPEGFDSGITLIDQFTIMNSMLTKALAGYKGTQAYGKPPIATIPTLNGKTRQSVVYQWFANVGESMQKFSDRDGGFDWDIQVRNNSISGDPQPYLMMWPIERGQGRNLILRYTADEDASHKGGNILNYAPTNQGELACRVWALGSGQAPDQTFAWEEDPALADGFMLTREMTRSFQSIVPTTLFEYARSERLSKSVALGGMSVDIDPESYALKDYDVGARTRLELKDAWYDLSYPEVRIVDRIVNYSRNSGLQITLDLDLDDNDSPAEETGV